MSTDLRRAEGEESIAENSQNERLQRVVLERLLSEPELDLLQRMGREQLTEHIANLSADVARGEGVILPRRALQQVNNGVLDEVLGYGPIQTLLEDPQITEIMVNGPDCIYIEREGKLELSERSFVDDEHVMRILHKIITPLGRRADESVPMVDARLPDGSRVNAIIPPASLLGPCVTIRKFPVERLSPSDLIAFGTMTQEMCDFLQVCVTGRLSIIVSGGTDSGKTTTLNVLSSFIPPGERIVTIEDAAELRLQQDHVIPLECRPPNIEGRGEITIRDLVRNTLRMRPNRIIVGEVRGAEALDMLQAMNTGHEGSLGTLHSNSPRDTLSRLETMVLMAAMDLPSQAIREQIARALHLIVHMARLSDGTRRVVAMTEVQRLEGTQIVLQDIFKFEQSGVDADGRVLGQFRPTGVRPLFMEQLEIQGLALPRNVFLR